jgi:hypothetical protein
MHKRSILVCDITLPRQLSARLTVTRNAIEDDVWVWTYIIRRGEMIASGESPTRLAAQVASQRAHENWLHLNRKQFNVPSHGSYQWREVE